MSDREGSGGGVGSPFDRRACPFCGTPLDEQGVGFVEHLQSNEACQRALARWRSGRSARGETDADTTDSDTADSDTTDEDSS